jgi:hypothetical protein
MVGSLAGWRRWTGLAFERSGDVVVPEALAPVHRDPRHDHAVYVEPNVWVWHDLPPATDALIVHAALLDQEIWVCKGPTWRHGANCSEPNQRSRTRVVHSCISTELGSPISQVSVPMEAPGSTRYAPCSIKIAYSPSSSRHQSSGTCIAAAGMPFIRSRATMTKTPLREGNGPQRS